MNIKITLRKFNKTNPHAVSQKIYSTTKEELMYFAATYGYRSKDVNYSELVRKVITLYYSLDEDSTTNTFNKSKDYKEGVADEKRYTSYVIGMTLCSFFAYKELGFKRLLHFDLVKNEFDIELADEESNITPDFISYDDVLNKYLIIEAKGVTNKFDDNTIKKGKEQVNQITTVNGVDPLRVVTMSYFDNSLEVIAEDPESKKGVSIKFDQDLDVLYFDVIKNIFESIREYSIVMGINESNFENNLNDNSLLKKAKFIGQYISGTPYYIGILEDVLNIDSKEYKTVIPKVQTLNEIINKNDDNMIKSNDIYLGNEGIIVSKRKLLKNF